MQSLGEERAKGLPPVRVEEKTEGNYNGKGLSVLRTRPRDGERGQPFQPAYASSLAGQSSECPNRCGRWIYLQGPCVHEVPEVRLRQESGLGSLTLRGRNEREAVRNPSGFRLFLCLPISFSPGARFTPPSFASSPPQRSCGLVSLVCVFYRNRKQRTNPCFGGRKNSGDMNGFPYAVFLGGSSAREPSAGRYNTI